MQEIRKIRRPSWKTGGGVVKCCALSTKFFFSSSKLCKFSVKAFCFFLTFFVQGKYDAKSENKDKSGDGGKGGGGGGVAVGGGVGGVDGDTDVCIMVVGTSGTGKTTLLNIYTGAQVKAFRGT